MSGRPLQDAIIIEIFAGTARVSACLRHFNISSAFGVDHLRAKNCCAPISLLDLTTPKGKTLLRKWLDNPRVVGISRARCIKLKRRKGGPPPLRSDDFPNGLQNLSFVDKIKVRQANKLYHLTAQIIKFAVARNILVCVENPQYSLFWATSFWLQVSGLLQYRVFHSCQYGSNRQKKTMLAHNHPAFAAISKQCPGESKTHRHLQWGITPSNRFATSEETAYPFQLARDIASAYVQALLEAGMIPPPETFRDLESQSEHVLQAVRAQSGYQPKIAKLPPLVPEFAKIITRKRHISDNASDPPLAKRLSSSPIESSRMKGGCAGRTPHDSDNQMEGEDTFSETWGIYHSPEEFIAKAAEAGHPHGMKQCLPDALNQAIKLNKNLSSASRAEHRTKKLKQWIQWSSELSREECELRETMHPEVRAILDSKKIKLWQKLLVEANYTGMGVVQEFVQGTSLVGEVEQCGLWPSKFLPALIAESELLEISERDKTAVLHRVSESCNNDTDFEVWNKTMEEVSKGWLKGPMQAHEVPDHCPISRRFGVAQGPKTRCVDDYTRSSVNLAVQVTESPKPHTIDMLSAVIVESMNECNNNEPWVIRTFDLKDAYRQCAVSPTSSKFAHIAVKNPHTGEAALFRMLALPFGSIRSVHSFLRVAHSLRFILTAHLGIICTNYFDDFVVLCRQSEATHLTKVVNTVLRLLGWAFAETGPKAPEFSNTAQALGVRVDVTNMHLGEVWVDNTESRKSDLSSCIQGVLQSGVLGTAEALKLRGRMQFTTGQLFGRLSRTALSKVTHHAYRSNVARISKDLQSALFLHDKFLLAGKPRLVSCGMRDTWFVFTDASYDTEDNTAKAGFGGVLVNPCGKCVSHFGFTLGGQQLSRLNPDTKKTIIHECEFLAVAIALETWKSHFKAKQIVCFIDNNAVRDSLISAKANGNIASSILDRVLSVESDNGLMIWFARVPSKSNTADDPSRGCNVLLEKLGSKEVPINVMHWLDSVAPFENGGS